MTDAAVPIAVLVAGSDTERRREARRAIDADPGLSVVGEARHERELLGLMPRLLPAVLLLDLDLGSGLDLVAQLMAQQAVPILGVLPLGAPRELGEAALAAGVVDVVSQLPIGALAGSAVELRRRLRLAARVRVISHPRGRLSPRARPADVAPGWPVVAPVTGAPNGPALSPLERWPVAPHLPLAAPPADQASPAAAGGRLPQVRRAEETLLTVPGSRAAPLPTRPWDGAGGRPLAAAPVDLVVIGASTGGPPALVEVLRHLPVGTSTAVLVVQHMAEGFVPDLIAWLNSQLAPPVVLAREGDRLQGGQVAVAPGARNTLVDAGLRVRLQTPPPLQFHTPGVDATMTHLAGAHRLRVLGVLLTGMGRDGALGMVALRAAGHTTLGQDEPTSAVYGMPMVAHELGGVETQLPLGWVGPAVASWCREPAAVTLSPSASTGATAPAAPALSTAIPAGDRGRAS